MHHAAAKNDAPSKEHGSGPSHVWFSDFMVVPQAIFRRSDVEVSFCAAESLFLVFHGSRARDRLLTHLLPWPLTNLISKHHWQACLVGTSWGNSVFLRTPKKKTTQVHHPCGPTTHLGTCMHVQCGPTPGDAECVAKGSSINIMTYSMMLMLRDDAGCIVQWT